MRVRRSGSALLTLHRPTEAPSDWTHHDEESAEVARVWASLEPVSGTETEQAEGQQRLERYKITTRWGQSIAECSSTWWATRENPVTTRVERYDFVSVRNVGERNREFEIEAVKRV